jgi:hypothetical protein
MTIAPLVVLLAGMGACGDGSGEAAAPVIDPGDGGAYQPEIDPASFVTVVDNPYLPLVPGSRRVYQGSEAGERIEIEVLAETRQVMGITATVVHDVAYVDGEVEEDTYDWFAQDTEGNVWYLGEDTQEFVDGEPGTRAGSWEAGVDGALPGIVMLAEPTVGRAYRQEFLAGEAEDMGTVIDVGVTIEVAGTTYHDVVVTRDWTPLEPDVIEEKYFAPGIGEILAVKVAGGDGREELIEHSAP